jgi:hypothetical protein
MTGDYQYTIAHQRIAELPREPDRERLAAFRRSQTTRPKRPSRLAQLSRRLARLSTT